MNKIKRRKLKRISPLGIISKLVIFAYLIILTVPFYFVIITSLKTGAERTLNPIGWPKNLTFENFVTALEAGNMLNAAKNSIIITGGSTLLFLFFVIVVSYCLHRIDNTKIGNAIYMYFLLPMFLPGLATTVTLKLRYNMGLYNNLFGEILCTSFAITEAVFITSGFLKTIPRDLEEAAVLDGANDRQICFQVVMPLLKATLGTLAVMHFKGSWNSAMGPLLYLRSEELHTIPMVLLLNFSTELGVNYTAMFAGSIITCIPIIIIYLKCQDYLVNAMTGAVKG